ncbi:hypothetical protein MRX96_042243 [Rhipicephalus microplus]
MREEVEVSALLARPKAARTSGSTGPNQGCGAPTGCPSVHSFSPKDLASRHGLEPWCSCIGAGRQSRGLSRTSTQGRGTLGLVGKAALGDHPPAKQATAELIAQYSGDSGVSLLPTTERHSPAAAPRSEAAKWIPQAKTFAGPKTPDSPAGEARRSGVGLDPRPNLRTGEERVSCGATAQSAPEGARFGCIASVRRKREKRSERRKKKRVKRVVPPSKGGIQPRPRAKNVVPRGWRRWRPGRTGGRRTASTAKATARVQASSHWAHGSSVGGSRSKERSRRAWSSRRRVWSGGIRRVVESFSGCSGTSSGSAAASSTDAGGDGEEAGDSGDPARTTGDDPASSGGEDTATSTCLADDEGLGDAGSGDRGDPRTGESKGTPAGVGTPGGQDPWRRSRQTAGPDGNSRARQDQVGRAVGDDGSAVTMVTVAR